MEASLDLAGHLYDSRSFGVVIGDSWGSAIFLGSLSENTPPSRSRAFALQCHALRPFLLCSCSSQDASLFDCPTDSTRLRMFLLVLLSTVDSAPSSPSSHLTIYRPRFLTVKARH